MLLRKSIKNPNLAVNRLLKVFQNQLNSQVIMIITQDQCVKPKACHTWRG